MKPYYNTAYSELVNSQLAYFNTNITKDINYRIKQLKKFKQVLKINEGLLNDAIYQDFSKSGFENYLTELSLVYHEINIAINNLKQWSRKKKVSTDVVLMPGKSYIMAEPLGVTLIIGAWNYPYQLSLAPAVASIAAGNTVIVKPSELAIKSSNAMATIINNNFNSSYFHVVEGGVEETTSLLKNNFDKIFYTGSMIVGKIVMKAAAEHLTPVTLELGGKSPCFIFNDAKLKITARRLVWAKFLNSGQTCVAPDYLLVEKGIKEKLITEIHKQIIKIHSKNPENSEAFVRIINQRHYDRLIKLIDLKKVIIGGDSNRESLYISPTVMDDVSFDDDVMQEEIFGPILPIIEFNDINPVIKKIKERPKPLALYVFTSSSKNSKNIFHQLSFGGGAVNDAVMQLANSGLPFGGVGSSGMGNYHGKAGFDTFSHFKSIYNHSSLVEPSIKYTPYSNWKKYLLRKMIE